MLINIVELFLFFNLLKILKHFHLLINSRGFVPSGPNNAQYFNH
jgi:hypothetical protein